MPAFWQGESQRKHGESGRPSSSRSQLVCSAACSFAGYSKGFLTPQPDDSELKNTWNITAKTEVAIPEVDLNTFCTRLLDAAFAK
jgi:hypothetical protein